MLQDFKYEGFPSIRICCPGNEIAKRLTYQTNGSSMTNVLLPPNWYNANFLGLALCAVVEIQNSRNAGGDLDLSCIFFVNGNNGQMGHVL